MVSSRPRLLLRDLCHCEGKRMERQSPDKFDHKNCGDKAENVHVHMYLHARIYQEKQTKRDATFPPPRKPLASP